MDRLIRAAQAAQVAQITALHAERVKIMGLGRGDRGLSVIGEVAMARNISPGAAGTQFELALGLKSLPQVAALFAAGKISQVVARAVTRETTGLHVDDMVVADAEIAPGCPV